MSEILTKNAKEGFYEAFLHRGRMVAKLNGHWVFDEISWRVPFDSWWASIKEIK